MTTFTVESLAKKIEADNAKFDKATDAEKRVIIAEDCLIRIELGQIRPETGNFCSMPPNQEVNIKQILDVETQRVCSACAKGSLFMAYLGRVNNFTKHNLINGNEEDGKPHLKLLEIFDLSQLALIEFAFEGKLYINKESDLEDLYFDSVCNFRDKVIKDNNFEVKRIEYDDYCHDIHFAECSTEVYTQFDYLMIKAICNNIIENKGEFVM